MEAAKIIRSASEPSAFEAFYALVRQSSESLCESLSDADATVQSMPDASPAKWHLAHTSWFFETMVLGPYLPGYRVFDDSFNFLFNSYYETIGARHPRPKRGMITRPSLEVILAYRAHVDEGSRGYWTECRQRASPSCWNSGCHHEQQHQELLLTDILHLFSQNPMRPAYKKPALSQAEVNTSGRPAYRPFVGGIVKIGHDGEGFAFDCEGPRHRIYLELFRLADRLVTNQEWVEFIFDGGYLRRSTLAIRRMGEGPR